MSQEQIPEATCPSLKVIYHTQCLSYYDLMFTEATLSQLVLQVEMETLPFSNSIKILVTEFSTNHKYIYVVNNGDENNMGCCELGTVESRYQDMF